MSVSRISILNASDQDGNTGGGIVGDRWSKYYNCYYRDATRRRIFRPKHRWNYMGYFESNPDAFQMSAKLGIN